MGSTERAAARPKTAVTNVRVFDGRQLLPLGTVVIEAGRIGSDARGAEIIDGGGAALLPGFIDAHVHLHDRHSLVLLSGFGVTTALDMGCAPSERLDSLRGVSGLTDIRSQRIGAQCALPSSTSASA